MANRKFDSRAGRFLHRKHNNFTVPVYIATVFHFLIFFRMVQTSPTYHPSIKALGAQGWL